MFLLHVKIIACIDTFLQKETHTEPIKAGFECRLLHKCNQFGVLKMFLEAILIQFKKEVSKKLKYRTA